MFRTAGAASRGRVTQHSPGGPCAGYCAVDTTSMGQKMASSPANNRPPVHRGAFASPGLCVAVSSMTPPRDMSSCRPQRGDLVSPVKRCCRVKKRGELDAVLVRLGRCKGLRIQAINDQPDFFEHTS